jgi:hypothetical protein
MRQHRRGQQNQCKTAVPHVESLYLHGILSQGHKKMERLLRLDKKLKFYSKLDLIDKNRK